MDVRRGYAGDDQAHGHDADPGQDLEPHRTAAANAKTLLPGPVKGDPVLHVLVLQPLRLWVYNALVLNMLAFCVCGYLFLYMFYGRLCKLITVVRQLALRGEVGLVERMSGCNCGKLECVCVYLYVPHLNGVVPTQLNLITVFRKCGWTRVWLIFRFFQRSHISGYLGVISSLFKISKLHVGPIEHIVEGGFVL